MAETEAVQIEAQKAPKATAKRADCDGLVGQGEVLQAATNSNRVNGISKGEQQSVQIHFTLGMEMEEIKDKRAKFQDELCEELCLALQARSGKMTVLELQAGSIITRIELLPGVAPEGMTTEDMVAELQRQLNNPSSVLRKGKYGSRALLLKVLSEEEIQALDRRDTASAEQKAAQTEAHISEENAAAVAMQQMERGMTARKEAAAKSAGGADHVPDHHVQKSIATNDAIKQAEDELERAEQKAALARMKTVQTEAQVLIKQAEIELANAEKAAAIAQQKALQMEAKLSAREALKQAEFEYAIAQNLLPDKGIDENGEVSTEVIGEGSKDGEGSKEAKVVQRGIRKRVLGAWCGTAEENAQKRMHLLAGATRTSRKCDTMSAFYALVLNLRASLGDDDESSGHPNADIEPLGWHHDSLQFQAAVRQLSAEKASETSNGANGANLRSGDSSNSTHARLARVHADLELATRAQELWNVSCPHCYGLFETREHAAVHVERCCYNPDLDTDHWAERWRCEHCSEIFETFDHADEHEQDCIFQVHDNICQVQV